MTFIIIYLFASVRNVPTMRVIGYLWTIACKGGGSVHCRVISHVRGYQRWVVWVTVTRGDVKEHGDCRLDRI